MATRTVASSPTCVRRGAQHRHPEPAVTPGPGGWIAIVGEE